MVFALLITKEMLIKAKQTLQDFYSCPWKDEMLWGLLSSHKTWKTGLWSMREDDNGMAMAERWFPGCGAGKENPSGAGCLVTWENRDHSLGRCEKAQFVGRVPEKKDRKGTAQTDSFRDLQMIPFESLAKKSSAPSGVINQWMKHLKALGPTIRRSPVRVAIVQFLLAHGKNTCAVEFSDGRHRLVSLLN